MIKDLVKNSVNVLMFFCGCVGFTPEKNICQNKLKKHYKKAFCIQENDLISLVKTHGEPIFSGEKKYVKFGKSTYSFSLLNDLNAFLTLSDEVCECVYLPKKECRPLIVKLSGFNLYMFVAPCIILNNGGD